MKYLPFSTLLVGGAIALTMSACDVDLNKQETVASNSTAPLTATATIKPTASYAADGTVQFMEVSNGVKVSGRITGLTAGKHGFHVHENGDCSNNAKAAGGHFNPQNHDHGVPSGKTHIGDLGNITASASGAAVFDFIDPNLKLSGKHSIMNRSVVVHLNADDLSSQPSGDAGPRVGCGIIK